MSKKYEAVIILDDQIHEDGGTVFSAMFGRATLRRARSTKYPSCPGVMQIGPLQEFR